MKPLTMTPKILIIALAGTLAACAAPQRSRTLQAAQGRLDSPRARQLEATQPQLVQQASAFAAAAKKAEERGETDIADLKAQQSIQRFETAVSLDERRATEAKMRAMETATESLSAKVEDLDREREALAKFRDAEARFQGVEAELAQVRADDKSARAEAQRAIIAARRKQAEAVGAKAPLNATDQYTRAETLLLSALAALDANLNADAQQLAEQARDGFDQSIVAAKGEAENQLAGAADKERAAGEKAREKAAAQDAIESAEVARAAAEAARLPQRDRARFQQGETYLTMARSRFKDGDYAKAGERAKAAADAYKGEAKDGEAELAIRKAEEARGRVLGMGLAASPGAREADYTLDLARDAQGAGDEARAVALAKKALALYQGVRPQPAVPGAVGAFAGPAGPAMAGPGGVTAGDLKAAFQQYEVERALVRIRHAHADALGAGKDAECPSLFRGFEAFIQLAEDRYAAGNHADAMQYATRAGERLAQCNPLNEALTPTTPGAGPMSVPKAPAKAEQTPSEKRAQQKAESALVIAKRLMIRAQTRKVDPILLEEPELLLQESQRWYAREAYVQADGLADEATKLLRKIRMPAADKVGEKDDAADPAAQPPIDAKSTKAGDVKGPNTSVVATNDAAPKSGLLPRKGAAVAVATQTCAPLQPKLNTVRQARSLAAARATTAEKQAQYVRALQMLTSVEGLVKDDRCKQAEPFLDEVDRLFRAVFKPEDTPVTPAALSPKAEDAPAAKTCAHLERPIQAAYVAQGVASARVTGADSRRRFERAVADLVLTERTFDQGKCADAKGHLDRAVEGFDALAGKPMAAATPGPSPALAGPAAAPAAAPATAAAPARERVPVLAMDSATSKAATAAIDRAESLKRRAASRQGTSTYQTGAQLLGKARDLAAVGRGAEASAVADQAAFAFSTAVDDTGDVAGAPAMDGALPSEWKPVYAMILDTLVLRDRARSVVKTDAEQTRFQSATGFMDKSRVAWRDKDYVAAKRFTEAAKVDLEGVLALAEARMNAPVPVAAPAVDPNAEANAQAARAQLRAVGVLRGRCMERDCKQTHPIEWTTADSAIAEANAAIAAGNWVEAKARAEAAEASLTDILNRPTFFIPAGTTGIRRVGNQLMLSPLVTFTTGGGAIEPSALPTIAALADVIKANDAVVERLRIVGHTDSRGSERSNLALSERRANTVRTALIDLGVSPSKVVAAGMGEANPIDSNKTAAGRERNRRVEFLLTVNQ